MFSGGEVDGKPVWAHWVWCKYGVDFIKQDGEWRIWHFRCYEVARAPFNRDWISFAKDNQESHDSQLAWFGDDGVPVFLPPVDEPVDDDELLPLRERPGPDPGPRPSAALREVRGHLQVMAAIPDGDGAGPTGDAVPRRPGVVLAVACAAQFVCVLDASIVNVALPPMQDSLGLSPTGLQWVVSSYTLTFAGFLLLGGRVGDLWGRKRAFLGGLLIFAVASLAAGLAQEGWHVVAARFVQGVGGAVLVPTTLSLVTTGFLEPRARAKALSLLTAAAAAGGALGGVIGGVLTGLLNWRWVFFVNVPLGVLLLLLAAVWALPGRPPGHVRGTSTCPARSRSPPAPRRWCRRSSSARSTAGHRRRRSPASGSPWRRSSSSSSSSGGRSSPSSRCGCSASVR